MTAEPEEQFDSIVMVYVLEHIRDDHEALRPLFRLLWPRGRLVLYVPAFWFLYSAFDRQIGHYRRYQRRELNEIVRPHGFSVVDDGCVNAVGALGWPACVRSTAAPRLRPSRRERVRSLRCPDHAANRVPGPTTPWDLPRDRCPARTER